MSEVVNGIPEKLLCGHLGFFDLPLDMLLQRPPGKVSYGIKRVS